jgi:hypothetical protein
LGGLLLGVMFSSAWIVGRVVWNDVDPSDARKIFARDVFYTVKTCTWDTSFCRRRREKFHRLFGSFRRPKAVER